MVGKILKEIDQLIDLGVDGKYAEMGIGGNVVESQDRVRG
jgi:hypothetical protein